MTKHLGAMTPLDYHVLLALAGGDLHGYAICQAIEADSGGAVAPRAGSLYRVIARLIKRGLIEEGPEQTADRAHPGLTRKYYRLTSHGKSVMETEVERLRHTTALAERRLGLVEGDRS